ncbi:MAG TPA: hypothetical protein VE978_02640, partial [Chitinophagales bacterium]|nr:hypothetical protein [Chitinophagales bacterium]
MKKLFLIGITCFAMQAHAQYFHRFFNETILFPPFRDEAFDDGLKSRVNYAGGDPQNYYFAATGSSEMAIGGNSDARLRFLHTAKNGTAKANTAFQFADVTPKWYETRGKDLCEIDNGQGTGGYIIVGEVNDNPATDALGIPGFTDWFFGKFTNSGGVSTKKRIDIDSGADVAHGVIRSLAVAGTYLVCGYSIKAAHVNAVVARITDAGAVVWLRSFNFVTPQVPCYTTSQCFAYSLCENPATGEIYVCGTIAGHKPGADRDGLLFAVSSAGFPLWQIYHDAGQSYDEYHDIKFTSNGYLLVCGFSDLATNLPNPFNDTWISLFAP